MKRAEITVFLSLVFILLVTFVGGIIESASIQVAKNYRRGDAVRAMECVFAEYQKELLEEYEVFGVDGGYESGQYEESFINKRMEYYGLVNSINTIERIQFLSDNNGNVFYHQVCSYMKKKYGIDFVKDKLRMTDLWKKQEDAIQDYKQEEQKNNQKLDNIFDENESQLPQEDNPIADTENLKKTPILTLVMPEGKTVSEKTVSLKGLPSHRDLNQGYGDFSDQEIQSQTTDRLLFDEYLLEQFFSATDESGRALDYEVEYLIAGKGSDKENLKVVVNRLLMFRLAVNFTSLQGDAGKKAEAQAIALTLCSLLAVPAIEEVVAQGILLAWAYEDSVSDVKALLSGQKVPFTKQGSATLGYKDYLRILLFLEKKDELGIRALDLIEQNLKQIQGLDFFKIDICITKLELKCRCVFRRGISYVFPVCFGYV